MPVLALQGVRGGVGTTSVTAALAWALQQLDESVLVIDFSPENLLRLHFNMSFEQPRGWAKAEVDGEGWQQGAMRYAEKLDFLPFGQLTQTENEQLSASLQQHPRQWQENLSRLLANASYRWILLDIPAGDSAFARQALALADQTLILIHADASCHIRLHQQNLPDGCHFLLNQFAASSRLQQDLHQLWLQSLDRLLPTFIHRDEAMAEALAAKQPLGEYSAQSLAAEEVITLANWCLINVAESSL
ncbi:TPA: cellulose synthase operon protein YhjQ [Yersinia enterocolitica]|uniref:cellulose biosynthesis protein BcsQ n=1 Tax=Yersinia enterocolitica TaxID=630 RepID=UPI00094BC55C|nr:cellulose biosynthesis protein BcsQ [Yersinia enterocolitica]MBW5834181.1 cellulose synthase operon protein YhjQ [Yersinia enterocolitica]MBX9487912.1 cellulose synthase operon protein YhjQ [Yersinia enterocolitica]MBX9494035.1 cellulose synthase operon protein YhjQ [Yersinia enterocolitica]HDL8055145.1 cellulose synthase operon protein YhjQ [Yersinia enterocolitica]HDM8437358.1 cellulose synthase operon protein YhjQ [Yersinia enterocolitica]